VSVIVKKKSKNSSSRLAISYHCQILKLFNMSFEVTGRLVAVFDIVQRTEAFKTREFVIEKAEDLGGRLITNYIKFQCVQDRTSLPDRVNLGDEIKVYFNLKGSKWSKDGREGYITNLDAWRLEQVKLQSGAMEDNMPSFVPESTPSTPIDDLPF
jgi:hypothetical protein